MPNIYFLSSYWPNQTEPYRAIFHVRLVKLLSLRNKVFTIVLPKIVLYKAKRIGFGGWTTESWENVHYNRNHGTLTLNDSDLYNNRFKLELLKTFHDAIAKYGLPDIVVCGFSLHAGYMANIIKKKYDIPYVIHEGFSGFFRGYFKEKDLQLLWEIWENAAELWPVSHSLKNVIHASNQNVKCRIIPYSVNSSEFYCRKSNPGDIKKTFDFCIMGNLTKNKRVDLVIQAFYTAFENSNNTRLHIVGKGPELKTLKKLASDYNINKNVHFYNAMKPIEVPSFLKEMDSLVSASIHETFGNTLIEALACGIPVISSDSGGPQDIVQKNNGILIKSINVENLSKAMISIKNNEYKFKKDTIRKDCLDNFDIAVIEKKITKAINKVISSSR